MATLLIGPAGKVPVDSAAKNGLTALHVAAQQNLVALAQLLVDNACAVDPRTNVSHLFSGRGGSYPHPFPKMYSFPQNGRPNCVLQIVFFCRCNDLLIDRGNILLMDSKLRKLFVTRQSKGCKFMPKCTEVRLLAGLCADPLGGDYPLLRPLSRNGDAAYF